MLLHFMTQELRNHMFPVTSEQLAQARELDLLTYLRRYEPDELIPHGNGSYATRTWEASPRWTILWRCRACPCQTPCGRSSAQGTCPRRHMSSRSGAGPSRFVCRPATPTTGG